MSAGTFTLYQSFKEGEGAGLFNFETGGHTFKCGFVSNGYSPADSHSLWSQVSANEISSTGYTSGGVSLTTDSTITGSTKVKYTVANFTVSGSGTKKVKYGVIYDTNSTPANRLVGYWDLETTSTTGVEATQITVSFPSTVLFKKS